MGMSALDPKWTLSSTSLVPLSGRGGPLAQEHIYNYRSGWRQQTSGKPRIVLDARTLLLRLGLLCDSIQCLLAVFGLSDRITGRGQHIAENLAISRLVLDPQNALAHAASTCRSTITGSVNANVAPWPTCDSTQILPPCISMMRFDIASPKPVPPFLRVMALSACWNS